MCTQADKYRAIIAQAQGKGDTEKARVFYALLQGHEAICRECKLERVYELFGRKVVVR